MSFTPYDQTPSVFAKSAFRGRVFGVTGSAHGIGEATVKQLARLGASVVVMDIDAENLQRVKEELRSVNASMRCHPGDVADPRFLKKVISDAHRRWGRIDGWVNNAMFNSFGTPERQELRDLNRIWQVNVQAAWVACGLLTPIMKAAGGGSIVNLGSFLSHHPHPHNTAYCTTKAAIEGFTRALAVDLARDRIRVNAVVPGTINTAYGPPPKYRPQPPSVPAATLQKSLAIRKQMTELIWRHAHPLPDQGQSRDAADAILFLLSDAARFITGSSLHVDGGAGAFSLHPAAIEAASLARAYKTHWALLKKHPTLRMSYLLSAQKKRLRGKK